MPSSHNLPQGLPAKPARLVSLDALRGFDMFWIIGGWGTSQWVLTLLAAIGAPAAVQTLAQQQLDHVAWDGLAAYDLIFPLFMFITGVTIPYTMLRKIHEGGSRRTQLAKVFRRVIVLVLVGMSFTFFGPGPTRLYSVLGLIGMGYGLAATAMIFRPRPLCWAAWVVGILVAYYLVLYLMPYPGRPGHRLSGMLDPEQNLAAYLDRRLITTTLYMDTWDPEGTIRLFPASAMVLIGGLAGHRIRQHAKPCLKCAGELLVAGLVLLAAGWLVGFVFPVIKGLWTSSFVLVAGGWSLVLLSVFYAAIDVMRMRWLGWFFIPIGLNPILIYAGQVYVDFGATAQFFFGTFAAWLGEHCGPAWQACVMASGLLAIKWLLLYFLHRQKVYLRV